MVSGQVTRILPEDGERGADKCAAPPRSSSGPAEPGAEPGPPLVGGAQFRHRGAPMSSESQYQSMRERFHPRCIACSPERPDGLRLSFTQTADGGVEAPLACTEDLEGYPGTVHGGVLALVFDSAMANCMFTRGYRAVTAELTVRYLGAVAVGEAAVVRVNVTEEAHPLYVLEGRIAQGGQEKARATGKFVAQAEEPG